MPRYKLVASGRSDVSADEIVLAEERDETTGELKRTVISLHEAREIPEEHLEKAHLVANRSGMKVVEFEVPEEDQADESAQQAGADTASAGPSVTQTGESSSVIDQQAAASRSGQATQQSGGTGTPGTSQSGTPATSATASTTPPPSNT